jgi:alkylhydroperoxidase family enzyme
MSRIKALGEPYPAEVRATFDKIMGVGVPPLVLFSTIASSDRAWRKFTGGSLLDGSLLTLRQRELVIDRVCARTACEYEWGVHVMAFAQAAGLSKEEVAGTLEHPLRPEHWKEEEAILLTAIDALHDRATLSDEEFLSLGKHFDDDQVLEILMLAGFYRTVSYIANGLALPLEQNAARFSEYQKGMTAKNLR